MHQLGFRIEGLGLRGYEVCRPESTKPTALSFGGQ